MDRLARANEIAEKLREEPYSLFRNDCIIKSWRFKKQCRAEDIKAKVVVCLGYAPARLFGRYLTALTIHGWGEVAGTRFEISRLLGSYGTWGIVPVNIKPLPAIRF